MIWSVLLVYFVMIGSPASAEEFFEEIPEDGSAMIAQEEYDYDEIGEPANNEFEEEWNLMQRDEEAYHELMEEKGYVYRTEEEKQLMAENDPHGTATALRSNAFTKNERSFVGWNAYWVEKNCWYYLKADGTKGWYKEGYEP